MNILHYLNDNRMASKIKEVDNIKETRKLKEWKVDNIVKGNFIKIPKRIKSIIFRMSSKLSKNEFILLNYIVCECLSFHRLFHWYKYQEILRETGMTLANYRKSLTGLKKKNIINVMKMDDIHSSKSKIWTNKVMIFNIFYDTWTIYEGQLDDYDYEFEETEDNGMNDEELLEALNDL